MVKFKQIYISYWKQLKFYTDENGMDWTFYSFEDNGQIVVKIGSPKYKISLSLNGPNEKNMQPVLAAGFWIPDSKEDFEKLKSQKSQIDFKMGKPVIWDSKMGRKSSWIWITTPMNLSDQKNWPASIEWFAHHAQKIRDICHDHLL